MTIAPLLVCIAGAILAAPSAIDDESLYRDLYARSYPSDLALCSYTNPWGERLFTHETLPENFSEWILTAARVYADQNIRFDGYIGSSDDGQHYMKAVDEIDNAYVGDKEADAYFLVENGHVDDLSERVWICLDLPLHALALAGFPIREALLEDYGNATYTYTLGYSFVDNIPETDYFFRRVRNLITYFERRQLYVPLHVTTEEYRDAEFWPEVACAPGDILFFGHYGDAEDTPGAIWKAKHSGIVATVDERGLPVTVFNMRVSQDLEDDYDGELNQTREIEGEEVFFERFADRYSLIGFGRIVNGWKPEPLTLSADE